MTSLADIGNIPVGSTALSRWSISLRIFEPLQLRASPALMTSLAMIAGMIPMALAFGQRSEEVAPLGRAVIGGLSVATLATLFLLPMVFGLAQRNASTESPSFDPEDPDNIPLRRGLSEGS